MTSLTCCPQAGKCILGIGMGRLAVRPEPSCLIAKCTVSELGTFTLLPRWGTLDCRPWHMMGSYHAAGKHKPNERCTYCNIKRNATLHHSHPRYPNPTLHTQTPCCAPCTCSSMHHPHAPCAASFATLSQCPLMRMGSPWKTQGGRHRRTSRSWESSWQTHR